MVSLAAYAWRLWREVERRKAFRAAEIARANQNCIDSLSALSQAMVERQVDMVEGALRCKVLLDIIDNRLVDVHRRACLFLHGLGHESGVHIVALRRLTDGSLEYEDLVCHVQGVTMVKVDFELCGSVFVDEGINIQRLCVRKWPTFLLDAPRESVR